MLAVASLNMTSILKGILLVSDAQCTLKLLIVAERPFFWFGMDSKVAVNFTVGLRLVVFGGWLRQLVGNIGLRGENIENRRF